MRDAASELAELGITPIGISPDKREKQKKFDDKYELGFRFLSDEAHAVAEAYGVWAEKTLAGKTYMGIVRSAFLVNEKGALIDVKYNISPDQTIPFVRKALGESEPPAKSAPQKVEWRLDLKSADDEEKASTRTVNQATDELNDLFKRQRYCVLATERDGAPYGNLVAFASTPDLTELMFVTSRDTRKYGNIQANRQVALVIDNRSNEASDLLTGLAVTALGIAEQIPESKREHMRSLYLAKHDLKPFLDAEDTVLIQMLVQKYIVVSGLDSVIELTPAE